MSTFWILLLLRVMEVVVTTGAIRHAKLQSKCHCQQTNTQLFTGRMPFLSSNQRCQSTQGKSSSTSRRCVTGSAVVIHYEEALYAPLPYLCKVMVHTPDIAPPPQKCSGMARVLKGFHSFSCTPTCSSAIGMSHNCLCLPSRSWYSFTDP